jgi:hypothetical protein
LFWVCCPGLADELIGCQSVEGLQATAEIAVIDEVIELLLEVGVTVVVIALDRCLLTVRAERVRYADVSRSHCCYA